MSLRVWIIAVLLMVPLVACDAAGGFNVRSDANWNYLTLTMSEQQVSDLIIPILSNGRDFRMQNVSLDLRPGELIARGDVVGGDGRLYPGSLSMRAWAAGGRLNLEVTTFNFAGFNADAAMLARFNADMAAGLVRDAANSDSETYEVAITDTTISITWRSPK
jgi:hypothetical protein